MNKRGFTIVELVIYMGIFSVLLLVFVEMFATLVNKQLETEALSNVQQDANFLLSRFSYDFSQAKSIALPAAPSTPSASLLLLIGANPLSYVLSSGNLISSQSGVLNQLNSSETTISNLTFQRLGIGNSSDVVQIKCDITSKAKKQSGYDVTHFVSTFGIREK
jgi:type II secretory pathway pseudopilin PulG